MASGHGRRDCLDPVSLVPLLMALPLDQLLLLLLLPPPLCPSGVHFLNLKIKMPMNIQEAK